MKFAYADPPYLGQGAKHYGHQHANASDYDTLEAHAALIGRLVAGFPAWALSLSTPTLYDILPLCPREVRIGGWFKPFASFKPNVNPAYCWEPVIFFGARSAKERGGREALTVRDYCSANITMQRGTSGAKPSAFCFWLFDFLGLLMAGVAVGQVTPQMMTEVHAIEAELDKAMICKRCGTQIARVKRVGGAE